MIIKFPKKVFYQRWLKEDVVIDEALAITQNTKRYSSRSEDQIFKDALQGLSLQYSVGQALVDAGYEVSIAPNDDKSIDLLVTINGKTFIVDVKGMFRGSANTFHRSDWEAANA